MLQRIHTQAAVRLSARCMRLASRVVVAVVVFAAALAPAAAHALRITRVRA